MGRPHSFPRHERLKSQKSISDVFSSGQVLSKYPIKVFYLPAYQTATHQCTVVVPKKVFRLAVDRNKLKRRMRESYRLNKTIIQNNTPIVMLWLFTGKEIGQYKTIEAATVHLLYVLHRRLSLFPKA